MKFAALMFLAAVLAGPPAFAATDWNGTWAGNWQKGQGTQIVFAGNELIAVYWNGDYVEGTKTTVSQGGKVMMVTWPQSQAVLTRDSDTTAHIVIHETGKADASFALKLDK